MQRFSVIAVRYLGIGACAAALVGLWPINPDGVTGFVTQARADNATVFLKSMAGKWRGRGTVKTRADDKPQAVACKITNTVSGDGLTLNTSGKCALANGSSSVSGSLTYDKARKVFSGRLIDISGPGQIQQSQGTLAGATLTIKAVTLNPDSGDKSQSVIAIRRNGSGRFSLNSMVTTAKRREAFRAAQLTFSKSAK